MRPQGSLPFQASGVSGVVSARAAPDLDARRRPARALRVAADFSAMRKKCARLRCSARRRRSATGRIPSGSAWRSNDERNAPRAALVIARGSLREWAMWAPIRPRSTCDNEGSGVGRVPVSKAVAFYGPVGRRTDAMVAAACTQMILASGPWNRIFP